MILAVGGTWIDVQWQMRATDVFACFCGCVMTPLPHLPQSEVGFGCFLDSFQSSARSNIMIGVGSASNLAVVTNPHVDIASSYSSALHSSSVFEDLQN